MRIWSLVAAILLGCIASDVMAQNASQSQTVVAVVDVGHILKNHPTMKADIERIEAQMKEADKEMTARRDAILKQMEVLRESTTEGTPEYEKREKEIAEQDTEFRLEIVKRRKEFDKARAQVLYKIYSEIKSLVQYASQQMGIQVVLRVNGSREELDPNKPETIQMLLGQEVIHYAKNVDLTEWILGGLKKQSTAQAGSAAPR